MARYVKDSLFQHMVFGTCQVFFFFFLLTVFFFCSDHCSRVLLTMNSSCWVFCLRCFIRFIKTLQFLLLLFSALLWLWNKSRSLCVICSLAWYTRFTSHNVSLWVGNRGTWARYLCIQYWHWWIPSKGSSSTQKFQSESPPDELQIKWPTYSRHPGAEQLGFFGFVNKICHQSDLFQQRF